MAHYAIGDLQGCFRELELLLAQIGFQHGRDTLWLVGDIVNRGPHSLECLQFCMNHPDSVQTVLGNHDLHLLAVLYGHGKIKRSDTIDTVIRHPQAKKMRDWLRCQPLLVEDGQYVLVHAGLLPQWSVPLAAELAAEVEEALQGNGAEHYFAAMYGNRPDRWSHLLSGDERLRLITNVLTRMRALHPDLRLDYDFKSTLADMPAGLMPWFDAPDRQHLSHTVVFGHWSALGYLDDKQVIALDTGALWGGKLTAVDLHSRRISQVDAQSSLHRK